MMVTCFRWKLKKKATYRRKALEIMIFPDAVTAYSKVMKNVTTEMTRKGTDAITTAAIRAAMILNAATIMFAMAMKDATLKHTPARAVRRGRMALSASLIPGGYA